MSPYFFFFFWPQSSEKTLIIMPTPRRVAMVLNDRRKLTTIDLEVQGFDINLSPAQS